MFEVLIIFTYNNMSDVVNFNSSPMIGIYSLEGCVFALLTAMSALFICFFFFFFFLSEQQQLNLKNLDKMLRGTRIIYKYILVRETAKHNSH